VRLPSMQRQQVGAKAREIDANRFAGPEGHDPRTKVRGFHEPVEKSGACTSQSRNSKGESGQLNKGVEAQRDSSLRDGTSREERDEEKASSHFAQNDNAFVVDCRPMLVDGEVGLRLAGCPVWGDYLYWRRWNQGGRTQRE